MSQQTLSRFFKNASQPPQKKGGLSPKKSITPISSPCPSSDAIKTEYAISVPNISTTDPQQPEQINITTSSKNSSPVKRTIKRNASSSETNSAKKPKNKTLTDFEQQMLLFKLDHMDKILLIQSGYKYKFFGEDAQIASRVLNIKLTDGKLSYDFNHPSKNDHLYSTFAQASIPVERLLVHVRRLVVKGYKVGVVDQIQTASVRAETKAKSKVFDRQLRNVYSAGTFINDEDLEKSVTGKSILCIHESGDHQLSLMSINVYFSTIVYDLFGDDFTRANLETRLHHTEPIEIITIGEISKETTHCINNFKRLRSGSMVEINQIGLDIPAQGSTELIETFKKKVEPTTETEQLIASFSPELGYCLYTLTQYLEEFNLISSFRYQDNYKSFSEVDKNIILDASVLSNLEIFTNSTTGTEKGTLMQILDHTLTKFGSRMLKQWIARPLTDKSMIKERHDTVDWLMKKMNSIQVERVQNILRGCPDLELIFSRIHYNKSTRKEVYCFLKKLNDVLLVFRNMNEQLISDDILGSNLMLTIFQELRILSQHELLDIEELIKMIHSPAAMDPCSTTHVTEYFNNKFYGYEEILVQKNLIDQVVELLNAELIQVKRVTKNKDLKFTKVGGEPLLIEIRKSNIKHVPSDWIRINATTNCARFRTPEIEKLYKKLKYQEDLLKQTCDRLFDNFIIKISQFQPQISKIIKQLAYFDTLRSLAIASLNNDYTKPLIVDIPIIDLKGSRNPIAERLMKEKPSFAISSQTAVQSQNLHLQPVAYIENDFAMQANDLSDSRIGLITGPNMGGKSSFMRQVALIVIMAQIGCFVPCKKGSILGVFNDICVRLGSNDNIFQGQSTFQVELTECKKILDVCEKNKGNSLILIDELGRGTSTIDGCSIAWSVLHHLINDVGRNVIVLFVTHYRELEAFQSITSGIVKNYHMGYRIIGSGQHPAENHKIKDENIMFTYKLKPGCSAGSFGVYCAKIAGINESVIDKAQCISTEVETEHTHRRFSKALKALKDKNIEKLFEIADTL